MESLSLFQIAVLAALQGITEFLPISSSGHLVLARELLGWPDPGLVFDVALHVGTLAGMLAYFARDWARLLLSFARDPRSAEARLLWLLALATIPGAVAGVALQGAVEGVFRGLVPVAALLLVTGAVLLIGPRLARRPRELDHLTPRDALAIGIAQAVAILPGVSRSGMTMAAGVARGLTPSVSARFSFMLAVPIILGAGLYESVQFLRDPQATSLSAMALGALLSAIVGYASIAWLLRILRRTGFTPFALYCFGVGGAGLGIAALGL